MADPRIKELAYQALISQFQVPNLGFESITDAAELEVPAIPSPRQEFVRSATPPSMTAFEPTMRQRLSSGAQAGLEFFGMRRPQARSVAQGIFGGPSSPIPANLGIADVVPFLGTALQTEEAGRSLGTAGRLAEQGEYGQAALTGGMGVLGLVPGAAGTVRVAQPIVRQIRETPPVGAIGPIDEARKIEPFSALQRDANELLLRNEPIQVFEPAAASQPRTSTVSGGQPAVPQQAAGAATESGQIAPVQYVQLPDGRFATSTSLSEAKRINVGFDTASSPEQAAHITAGLRKSPQEQLVAIVVDENDKPIQIVRHTIGLASQTSAEPFSLLGAIANTPGAKGFWLSHNHPSGTASLSMADTRLAKALYDLSENTGIENKGILAIGKDKFAFYDPKTANEMRDVAIPPAPRNKPISIVERVFKKTNTLDSASVTNDSVARDVASKIAGEDTGLILMNAQRQPVAFLPLEDIDLGTLRETGIAKQLFGALENANATSVLFVSKKNVPEAQIENLASFFSNTGTDMIDALTGKDLKSNTFLVNPPPSRKFRGAAPIGIGAAATQEEEVE